MVSLILFTLSSLSVHKIEEGKHVIIIKNSLDTNIRKIVP